MESISRTSKILICVFGLIFWSSSAFAAAELKKVGELASFSGDVLLKHKGFWGEPLEIGMTLYHGDKVLTREGTCQVRFSDGSELTVSPNSSVRLAEFYAKHGAKLVRQRDIRLFLGKVRYASGSTDPVQTQLAAPTAVAALRGTDVAFGTDGILATLNMLDGESDISGNITQVDSVPGATAAQANANAEYKASETAGKVRKAYLEAVQSLLTSQYRVDGRLLLAAADPALVLQIIAQSGGDGAVANAHKVLLLAALYTVADMNALIEENKALLNNPDERTAVRASEALAESQEKKEEAVQTLNRAKETVQNINEILKAALSGDPATAQKALQDLKPVISQMMADQKRANRVALGKDLIVNIHTAGVDEALTEYEERENKRMAEEAADDRADDFQQGVPIEGSTDALIDDTLQENGDNLEGTPLDETIRELEAAVGALAETLAGEIDRFPDLFPMEIPEPETETDRDGDGVPNDRDLDPSNPNVSVDKGGYAN